MPNYKTICTGDNLSYDIPSMVQDTITMKNNTHHVS